MKNRKVHSISSGYASSIATSNTLQEIKFYRLFPNYPLIIFAVLMLLVVLSYCIQSLLSSLIFAGLILLLIFMHQGYAYKNRKKPMIIVNAKGFWYAGLLYRRPIFFSWATIRKISYCNGYKSGEFVLIYTASFFPKYIGLSGLNASHHELRKAIDAFYKGPSCGD